MHNNPSIKHQNHHSNPDPQQSLYHSSTLSIYQSNVKTVAQQTAAAAPQHPLYHNSTSNLSVKPQNRRKFEYSVTVSKCSEGSELNFRTRNAKKEQNNTQRFSVLKGKNVPVRTKAVFTMMFT
jgi:hypothetical protein